MSGVAVSEALADGDRSACHGIRVEVFCGEQGIDRGIELDGLDGVCRHYLARDGGAAVGTARARPLGDGAVKLERVAVLAPHRGRGIGRALMVRALADARSTGHRAAVLHSQTEARAFYGRLGFLQEGPEFEEAGVPHVRMTLDL